MAIGTSKPTRFFIPSSKKTEAEAAYSSMKEAVVDQLKLRVENHRINKLTHTSGKRVWHFQVGQPKPQESQYVVMAIFESSVFIVVNKTTSGEPGPIVLIDKNEVTAIEDFQE